MLNLFNKLVKRNLGNLLDIFHEFVKLKFLNLSH